ncbi:hypothetical protein DEMA109039_08205 [Deinococcus marmoris]
MCADGELDVLIVDGCGLGVICLPMGECRDREALDAFAGEFFSGRNLRVAAQDAHGGGPLAQ